MKIRLVKPWQFRAVGLLMDLPDGVAEYLILRGTAARVNEEQLDIAIAPVQRERPHKRTVRATA